MNLEVSPLEELLAEQAERWQRGDPVRVDHYFDRFPALASNDSGLVELICQEFLLRLKSGEDPSREEYLSRFPGLADKLEVQFDVLLAVQVTLAGSPRVDPERRAAEPKLNVPTPPGYRILGVLGQGGMGVAYKAWQERLHRVVALKMIRPGSHRPEDVARFCLEAEAIGRLQHPHIVQVFDFGEFEGSPYLALEYVDGGSLDRLLGGAPMAAPESAALVEILARAVHHAHASGVVHRDLKPGNILIAKPRAGDSSNATPPTSSSANVASSPSLEWSPKITDFGLARLISEAEERQTTTGAILGTPSYMSPEQAAGNSKDLGPAADIYSLGVILYELLTGRPPFRAATPMATIWHVQHQDPVAPRQLVSNVPIDLQTICLKCLEKNPSGRYATAEALAEDLRRFRSHEPILARPSGFFDRVRKWRRRRPAVAALLATLSLVLLGALAGFAVLWRMAEHERANAIEEGKLARKAEKTIRNQLAEAEVQSARLAMRQGAWRQALVHLDGAIEAGSPDVHAIALMKARAYIALHDLPRSSQEIRPLLIDPKLGTLRSQVLLVQADLMFAEKSGEEAAMALVREALAADTLPAAERSYARGLVAESTPESLRHFQEAVREDPFHHRANGMLGLLLILQGQHGEARDRIVQGELLFPDDPSFCVLHALLEASQDRLPAAEKTLGRARAALGPQQYEASKELLAFAQAVSRLENALLDPADGSQLSMLRAMPTLLKFSSISKAGSLHLILPVPPVVTRVFSRIASEAAQIALGGPRGQAALTELSAAHPDALLDFLRGVYLGNQGKWAEAERIFQGALEKPSFFSMRKPLRYSLATSQWMQTLDEKAEGRKELLDRALGNTRKCVELGGYRPNQAATLACIACDAADLALARWIVAESQRQEPNHLGVLRQSMRVEYRAGDDGQTIRIADKILAQAPRDETATRVRALAIGRLEKTLQAAQPKQAK